MRVHILIAAWALLCFSSPARAQRLTVGFDRGWTFTSEWETRIGAGTEVTLPHTWNADPAHLVGGTGTYLKTISVPAEWRGNRVYIRFGGATGVCHLTLNGRAVGEHRGGYTPFTWDITNMLNYGERNTFWVRVSDSPTADVLPLGSEATSYGGLTRSVELVVAPAACVQPGMSGGSGIAITPFNISEKSTQVNIAATLAGPKDQIAEATVLLCDAAGSTLDSVTRRVKFDDKGASRVAAAFGIDDPHLWNSVADPYLYNVEVRVAFGGKTDRMADYFGIRTFGIDGNNQFVLNGKPFRIRGVGRIEDRAVTGSAMSRADMDRDIGLMREMGVNAVRVAYRPCDPYFIEQCDRAGIIVWCDLPLTGLPAGVRGTGYTDTEALRMNARQQLREMIATFDNRPSVIFWGLYHELSQRGGSDPVSFVRELHALAKAEDPDRLTACASNQDGALNFITDVTGFNQFLGWSSGTLTDADRWAAELRKSWSKLPAGLSQYGAGGSINAHTDRPQPQAVSAADVWHPEEWQCAFHEHYLALLGAPESRLWGAFAWSMFDYGAAVRPSGAQPGIADYGLVTYDRTERKDAFYLYKANWNSGERFVHITSKRWKVRPSATQNIKVYSNAPKVVLIVNGSEAGTLDNDGLGRFVWNNVPLKPGPNTIAARDPDTGFEDIFTLTVDPQRAEF